jgi:glutamate racemase
MKELNASQAIGFFDSGIGGLTVAKAVVSRLPNEQIIYFGDTAHMPYGDRSPDSIRYYCLRIVKFLRDRGCKMVVIACNTASSVAYQVLNDFYKDEMIFVNVVDPLVAHVASSTYQKVGVIATKVTINSRIYEQKITERKPEMEVRSLATPLLAPMIESGYIDDKISHTIVENYLSQPELHGIEALLLACTHYPLIRPQIEAYFTPKIAILDSTDVVAEAVYQKLKAAKLLAPKRKPTHHFYVSEHTQAFEDTAKLFYGGQINLEHNAIW